MIDWQKGITALVIIGLLSIFSEIGDWTEGKRQLVYIFALVLALYVDRRE